MLLERGALLNNRYRIVEILGQGGMGSVYRAVDENLGVEVAVKDNLFTTEEYARQFRREAVILANLRHPNLPRVTDHFVIDDQGQYLVMDYIEGEDLRQRMDRVGVLSDEEVIVIGAAICDAMTYLHSRSQAVVHRDIKPGNVKITPQGQIYLVDFGLAKVLQGSQATTTGARAMTPGYSPPEQYGTARTDHRSDIFSLGATLYAALTGEIPEDALARAMEQVELTPIRKFNPRVSRRLGTVVEKSLAVRPDERYQNAEEFKQALLSARQNTRRRTGELLVTPPPDIEEKPLPEEVRTPSTPLSIGLGGMGVLPGASDRSPLPLQISTSLDDDPKPKKKRARKGTIGRGCWLVMVLTTLLLVGGLVGIYVYDVTLLTKALAMVWPVAGAPVAGTENPTESATPTESQLLSPSAESPLATSTLQAVVMIPTSTVPSPTDTPEAPTPTFTPSPTRMGGGVGQLAFASDRNGSIQIYLINTDGTGLRQLTDMVDGACQPAWSPDGNQLVFTSPCSGNKEIYTGSALFILTLEDNALKPLPTAGGGDFDPAWSPDGEKIVFSSTRGSGRPQLYLLELDKNNLTLLSQKYGSDLQPTWSPDGERILYVSDRRGTSQLWIMDANGENQELFTINSKELYNTHPAWSPDGLFIIFTQTVTSVGFPKLAFINYESGDFKEYRLSQDSTPMREAQYSPDGFWLAMESWGSGSSHDIFLMGANGGGKRALTSDSFNDFDPTWRPGQE